ncbi:MAG: phospholipase A [Desulfobacter sp.]|nr:MAG: phospholipase A [Desulfobacter sp.]
MKKGIWGIAVLLLGLWGTAVAAAGEVAGPDLLLSAPQNAKAGTPIRFTAVFTNSTRQATAVPDKLELSVENESGGSLIVTARVQDNLGGTMVPAQGFVKKIYGFCLPEDMAGILTMSVPGNTPVMFSAAKASPGDGDGRPGAMACGTENGGEDKGEDKEIRRQFQPFLVNFSSHKPVYFLFGLDPGIQGSSFQISFKYRLFNFHGGSFGKKYLSGLENLRLAYTQQSFWDLKSDSAPFEDSRYMPELFYEYTNTDISLPWLTAWGGRAGLQHESNGRGGDLSRSTNYGYIQPFFAFKLTDQLHWKFAPKAWVYVRNEDESNGDLADYRGYFDIENKIGDPQGFVLENHFRQGRKGGTWQFDLSYPLDRIPWFRGFVDMYLHAQYVTGYSDQLLIYDQREDIIRLGFSLVR